MANSDGYPWESDDDQLAWTRVFIPSRAEETQMGNALQLARMPGAFIRRQLMGTTPMPPRYAYGPGMPDILTCFEPAQPAPVHSIMDYTSDEAALQSSSRPSLGQW